MPDISAINAGLSSLKAATDIVNYLRSLNKQLEAAEFKLKLAELTETLAEVKLRLVEAQEENSMLKQHVRTLTAKRDLRSALCLKDNVYVPVEGSIDGYGNGPWCTNCFDTSGNLIALHHNVAVMINDLRSYQWECPNCKSSVAAPTSRGSSNSS